MVFEHDDEKPYEFLWFLRLQHTFFLPYQQAGRVTLGSEAWGPGEVLQQAQHQHLARILREGREEVLQPDVLGGKKDVLDVFWTCFVSLALLAVFDFSCSF